MSSEKTLAIVLRVVEFSETSCIVTLMTRDFGKLSALAKGARRPKSPFEAAIDLLAICRVVFLHKTNALSLLTEAKLERRFRASQRDLGSLYAAFYIAELLQALTDEGDPHPELYDLTVATLARIDDHRLPPPTLKQELLHYEFELLRMLGHFPMLTRCVSCGREKTTLSQVNFGLQAGGILCQECRRGQPHVVTLSPAGFDFLLNLVGGQVGPSDQNSDNWKHREPARPGQRNLSAEPSGIDEIRSLIQQYITHLIGRQPRLYRFLHHLES